MSVPSTTGQPENGQQNDGQQVDKVYGEQQATGAQQVAGGQTAPAYDVVVVGGGAAGLSAALTLSRARRSVLVVDAGAPRNAPAGHIHNYLGREGTPPAELLAIGRAEVASYGGQVVTGTVASAQRLDRQGPDSAGDFAVALADGRYVRARRLLVTSGLVDGRLVPRRALVVTPRLVTRSQVLESLGMHPVQAKVGEMVIGTRIPAEANGATAVPGVYVAGNVTDVLAQVIAAAAAGLAVGATINADLIADDTARAVSTRRARSNSNSSGLAVAGQ